ncbi:MAG TPA: BON domain-containing protein [Salinivirga sp.]|uniref:BON domain-containing protein n=1 Tax=Salinivirga sp. TaxID=1970192 RepID=UPI002B47B144|nr:BON domain-containing protein [Salinivirga sp.]HKK58695.1 BON domain-containing protein [Salinivirga sp.]
MRLKVLLAGLLIALATIGWSQENISDQKIADAIQTEYQFDHAINFNRINIKVNDGIAELTGTVSNIKAKERATKIAEMVKGVRSVSNRITVNPPVMLTDESIEKKVTVALLNDPATESYEVNVSVMNKKVTLSGKVDSYREKQLAGNVAKSVVGVKSVSNKIEINYDLTRTDDELQNEIESALKWSKTVDDGLIDVKVKNNVVKLSGTVGSAAEKRNARYLAWITGVKDVDVSNLDVEWWAKDENLRKNKNVEASDQKIEDAITDAALFDPRVYSFDIAAESDNGWVTLRGTVDNMKARQAAENLAKHTIGVKGVTNRIKVELDLPPADLEIKDNVIAALARNSVTESYEISVDVNAGIVTLSGLVDSYMEKMEAEWVASGVKGVTTVKNMITVNSPYSYYWWDDTPFHEWYYVPAATAEVITITTPNDKQIKKDVESQLWWSPYVDADDVKVNVQNGDVTLTGTADNMTEFQRATENAWEGGAWNVENNLKIK